MPSFLPELGPPWPGQGEIMVVTAGAADIPVGAEAYGALRFWGHDCGFLTDVGVAGLHRLAPHIRDLRAARLIIAVAGMEGALPGVLAGLVPCPVLAVPTSAWARAAWPPSTACSVPACPVWPSST